VDLTAYRRDAETFVAELMREHYRHYSGLKDDYEIEPIYDRHRDLFGADAVDALRGLATAAPAGGDERRGLTMLLDFAVEGHLGEATKAVEAELARREAELTVPLGNREIGFRESSVVQANEPDADVRAEIEHARLELTERELGGLYRELIEHQHDCARRLGWSSYSAMCSECKAVDYEALHAQTLAFSAASEASYAGVVDPVLERALGFGLDRLRRADIPRFFRAPDLDRQFPSERLLPSFLETMRGLGIDADNQPSVNLDLEPRPHKSPRPFCAPVRVPSEIHLVLAPVGGRDDYAVLMHEGGHTEHYAHVDGALAFEFRYLGDNAITEAYAFLFEHLVGDREWLARRLGVEAEEGLVSYERAQRLIYTRRYCAKLTYELELHGANGHPPESLAARYAQLLGSALQIEWPSQTYLADVDPGFYVAAYLRAWALEAYLRHHLRERFGAAWFDEPEAGELLRELWREGQRISPEELLERIGGQRLDFGVLLEDLEIAA
jgi:hypothetical protein